MTFSYCFWRPMTCTFTIAKSVGNPIDCRAQAVRSTSSD